MRGATQTLGHNLSNKMHLLLLLLLLLGYLIFLLGIVSVLWTPLGNLTSLAYTGPLLPSNSVEGQCFPNRGPACLHFITLRVRTNWRPSSQSWHSPPPPLSSHHLSGSDYPWAGHSSNPTIATPPPQPHHSPPSVLHLLENLGGPWSRSPQKPWGGGVRLVLTNWKGCVCSTHPATQKPGGRDSRPGPGHTPRS